MPIDKGTITGHFMAHLGVPSNIRPRQVNPFGDFAILEFAPKGTRNTWRYAANGMSCRTQVKDQRGSVRTEAYLSSQHQLPWVA